jgi:chromosome partitioning protein
MDYYEKIFFFICVCVFNPLSQKHFQRCWELNFGGTGIVTTNRNTCNPSLPLCSIFFYYIGRYIGNNLTTSLIKMTTVITISTSKGGQGKSTTNVLLATALASEPLNKRVLLLDMDLQRSIYTQRLNDLKAYEPGTNVPFEVKAYTLKELEQSINKLRDSYDYIFIDSAGSFDLTKPLKGQEIYQILIYTDLLLIPFSGGNYNLESTIEFLKMALSVQEVKQKTNVPLSICGFITMYESRLTTSKELLKYTEQIAEQTNIKFIETPLKKLSAYSQADTITSLYKENPTDTPSINFHNFTNNLINKLEYGK